MATLGPGVQPFASASPSAGRVSPYLHNVYTPPLDAAWQGGGVRRPAGWDVQSHADTAQRIIIEQIRVYDEQIEGLEAQLRDQRSLRSAQQDRLQNMIDELEVCLAPLPGERDADDFWSSLFDSDDYSGGVGRSVQQQQQQQQQSVPPSDHWSRPVGY
eukprot:NODE_12992_length_1192_cov_3.379343.p2 GENE.NODE_12992_length_1192_cov_3.379343~~NODE_12992_length_1192_cov_3.379343.p2  ORF type:complete len:158 (-),score=52.60 NODE_12992_length_1192_cov_3.379343:319-792(-)